MPGLAINRVNYNKYKPMLQSPTVAYLKYA